MLGNGYWILDTARPAERQSEWIHPGRPFGREYCKAETFST